MAAISNGWFQKLITCGNVGFEEEIQLYKPMPLFMMGVNECLIRYLHERCWSLLNGSSE
jgi:hypothetical protein